jgi:hypothetical protein
VTAKRIGLRSVQFDRTANCSGCGGAIRWAVTSKNGKNISLEVRAAVQREADGTYTVSSEQVHWTHCPKAAAFRRGRGTAPSEQID